VVAVNELWVPPVRSADVVAVSADARIWIVECKLHSNPEIRRHVVGQILAYAAGLWAPRTSSSMHSSPLAPTALWRSPSRRYWVKTGMRKRSEPNSPPPKRA
jgi:hypothetical protein